LILGEIEDNDGKEGDKHIDIFRIGRDMRIGEVEK
jgi:hypothetical protein